MKSYIATTAAQHLLQHVSDPGQVAARHADIGAQVADLVRARTCTILDVTVGTSLAQLRDRWLDEQKGRERAGTSQTS